jgi:NOL1/NOP2/fmu family ribosome biogenesis protein
MTKLLDLKTKTKIINYLNSRFGIDKSYLDNYMYIIKGNSVSVVISDRKEIIQKMINSNFVKNIGIEIFSNYKDYVPSSLGFGIFKNSQILNNFVNLDRTQANNYFKGKEINTNDIKTKNLLSSGYVVCIYNNQIIGTAKYIKEETKILPNLSFVNEKIK